MKIIITGGAGFIGSRLAREFVKRGDIVKIIDNLLSFDITNIVDIKKNIIFKKGDVRDHDFLLKEFRGYDAVLHHAALTSVPKSIIHPREYHDVNATGTLTVLHAALKRDIARVVFASSCAVYGGGASGRKNKETDPIFPLTPYAVTKMIGEQYCRLFHIRYRLQTISLRYFNVYGGASNARSPYASVIAAFARNAQTRSRPRIFGTGKQTRDFVFIDDIIRANILALSSKKSVFGVPINIGTGAGASINELFIQMKKIVPLFAPRYLHARSGDIHNSVADIARAKQLLGFTAKTALAAGLEKYLQSSMITKR